LGQNYRFARRKAKLAVCAAWKATVDTAGISPSFSRIPIDLTTVSLYWRSRRLQVGRFPLIFENPFARSGPESDIENVNAQKANFGPPAARRRPRGFTLVEAALTMVIIGTGVLAMLQLLTAGTMSNSSAAELTTAVQLANNVHEIALSLPFTCPTNPTSTTFKDTGGPANYTYLWDLNGDSYKPPLDIRRNAINTYSTWTQQVTVQSVDPTNLDAVRPNSVTLPTARLTVVVLHNSKKVYRATWLICAPNS